MNETPLLSGPSFGPATFTQTQSQARSPRLLRIFVLIWLLGGFAYFAVRLASNKQQPAEAAARTAQPITAGSAEDLAHHVAAVMEKIAAAGADLHRAEDQVNRALSGVARNDLLVEKRRLENALAVTETARRDIEQTREDLALIQTTLEKEHSK